MFGTTVRLGWPLIAMVSLSACVGGDPDVPASEAVTDAAPISVTVPAARSTPFCAAMIDLSDRLASGVLDDVEAAIVGTYRDIRADVPIEIAGDFDAVLTALEAGAPPPTDPTTPTTPTSVPSSTSPTETAVTQSTVDGSVDEGFDPRTSPAERVNDYVVFVCRNSENNPGPPATQPGAEVATTNG